MAAAQGLADRVGVKQACQTLSIPRSTFYRKKGPTDATPAPRPRSVRALTEQERHAVHDVLNSERFCDKTPRQVWAELLDEGRYLCSISTMCRILRENDELKERRNQLQHPTYQKPELLARAPNELWSWDITKMKGPQK